MDEPPQHSQEAEAGVLGCILLDQTKLDVALQAGVTRRWFYISAHQELFSLICQMRKAGQGVDQLSLLIRLQELGRLHDVGGQSYLMQLENSTPSAANIEYYLEPLKDNFRRRALEDLSARIRTSARDTTIDAEVLSNEVQTYLRDFQQRLCHRADQNQPVVGTSKPANLRREIHNRFGFGFKEWLAVS